MPIPALQYYISKTVSEVKPKPEIEDLYRGAVELTISAVYPLSRVVCLSDDGSIVLRQAFIDKSPREIMQQQNCLQATLKALWEPRVVDEQP